MTLVMGRVFVLLGCSEAFARMALPVLMDGVVSGHSQQPAATYACLTKTMAGGWWASRMPSASALVKV